MRHLKLALIIAVLVFCVVEQSVFADAEYNVVNLRLLAGPDENGIIKPHVGYAINDLGQVTGHGYMQHYPLVNEFAANPFLYDPATGHIVNCGDMDGNFGGFGHASGNGYGISNDGWVTGRNATYANGYQYDYRAFLWKDLNGNGISDPGEMRDLGTDPPCTRANGWQMNNHCQVIGTSSGGGESKRWIWTDANNNRQYDAGEKRFFDECTPIHINDAGQIAMNKANGVWGAWRWSDDNGNNVIDTDELTHIPNIVSDASHADEAVKRINKSGQVAGRMEDFYQAGYGFLWTDANENNEAEECEILTFGKMAKETHVRDMNDVGQIVGGTYALGDSLPRQAFVWDPIKGMRNLNDMIDYEVEGMGAFRLSQAEGINNMGQICANGRFAGESTFKNDHAMVLTGPRLLLCQVFLPEQNVATGLGWTVGDQDTDTTVEVHDDSGQYVLRLKDEGLIGTDAVSISQDLEFNPQYIVEFRYRFLTDGKLEIIVDDEVIHSIVNSDGAQGEYTDFSETFGLNRATGEYDFTLRLSNVADPEIFLDNLYVETSIPTPGDANCDGFVDVADYTLWADNYGRPDAFWAIGDFNDDGVVDVADYTLWADNYNPEHAPEPTTMMLLGIGALGLIRRRRGCRHLHKH